jgi:hypothetical protein
MLLSIIRRIFQRYRWVCSPQEEAHLPHQQWENNKRKKKRKAPKGRNLRTRANRLFLSDLLVTRRKRLSPW